MPGYLIFLLFDIPIYYNIRSKIEMKFIQSKWPTFNSQFPRQNNYPPFFLLTNLVGFQVFLKSQFGHPW